MNHPRIYYLIFAVSGFSGLIYESVWTHYLKLVLGHAAYAQTLVLAIFMAGMALGAALCSKYSRNWSNLLQGYAVVEGIIGICALIYHPLFEEGINYAYQSMIPAIGSHAGVEIIKWGVSTLSIFPQSILLGMTFPLMSGAFLRLFPERSGNSLSLLYFTNSFGAVFGVLASGFVLIRVVGLPGTLQIAGAINLAIALVVWLLSRGNAQVVGTAPAAIMPDQLCGTSQGSYRLFLLISLGTGAASFVYEVGWIRMLALVLGSSTQAFELMLSAFLVGLALGGLQIRRRIDTMPDPIYILAIIQIVMGLLALSTLPFYDGTFSIMQWLMRTLPKTDTGYILFNLGSYGIAAAIMVPATFCAGMTLPLITNILFRQGHGEKSIGAVYAANTVGGIIGVFGAVHLGMPLLGLKGVLVCGVTLDMALGILLIWIAGTSYKNRRIRAMVTAGCVAVVILVVAFIRLDPYKMASGVYQLGSGLLNAENESLVFYRDGKTTTVSVVLHEGGIASIRNNGKSDSDLNLNPNGPASTDEPTTILLGAIPMMFKPDARFVANIGLGTGLTTQTLLSNPGIEQVDTIEIESAEVEGAHYFRSRNDLVFSDPRSRIIVDDAKSVFSSYGRKYDIIISEPPNPWVSGVASLFTEEFYRLISLHLRDDGLYAQWLQLYGMDSKLLISILKALSSSFADYSVFLTAGNADIMVVAKKKGRLGVPKDKVWALPAIKNTLARIGVNGLQDIRIRELGSKEYLDSLLNTYDIRANSDYFPLVDQMAAKARFMSVGATSILRLATNPLPYMHLLAAESQSPPLSAVTAVQGCSMSLLANRAVIVRNYLLKGESRDADGKIVVPPAREATINLRRMLQDCRAVSSPIDRKEYLFTSATVMLPYLTAGELEPIWDLLDSGSCRSTMTTLEKEYLSFFKALGRRDFRTVAILSRQLLATDREMPRDSLTYLATAGMLASLAQKDPAQSLWFYNQAYAEGEQPDLNIRLLYALSR